MEREYHYDIDSDSGSYSLNEVMAKWLNCTEIYKKEVKWKKHPIRLQRLESYDRDSLVKTELTEPFDTALDEGNPTDEEQVEQLVK